MTCPCDSIPLPRALTIPPGLSRIERQIIDFPELRYAMLRSISSKEHAAALERWAASGPDDLGVMLVEMWAYLGEILAFYDEVHAHECYLRTARREDSTRALVERLGYRPRPAVAAIAEVALLADGRRRVAIPAGTAFRSSAFADEPPQVFEMQSQAVIHPLRSRLAVAAPVPGTVDAVGGPGASPSTLLLDPACSAKWNIGDRLLLQPGADPASWRPTTVTRVEATRTDAGAKQLELTLDPLVELPAGTPIQDVRLLRPARQAGLWIMTGINALEDAGSTPAKLTLDGLHRDLRAGDLVLVSCARPDRVGQRWFKVTSVAEVSLSVTVATLPAIVKASLPATKITLDADIDDASRGSSFDWNAAHDADLVVHYDLREAGRLISLPQASLLPGDPLILAGRLQTPADDSGATRFALQDVDGRAVALGGSLDFAGRQILAPAYDGEPPTMTLPAQLYGNMVMATRGETIEREVLGSGDATAAGQSFTLRKSPLTYIPSATAAKGYASTLRVWVDGVRWTETDTFFGTTPGDRVYVVRLDAAGVATVTFGDGVSGARLPTGVDNVVASYRRGAGAAAPPAGSIAQIARGVPGLRAVHQPFTAYGGSDAEPATSMRTSAPRQALTLDRAVSIRDVEAFAMGCNGARAVAVRWAWSATGLQPTVMVWVAGDGDVAATVRSRLLAVTDTTMVIEVAAATAVPVTLALDVRTDEAFVGSEVVSAVAVALLDAPEGLLTVDRAGIGKPFYFSRLADAVHAVTGVLSMSATWTRGSVVVTSYSDSPGEGAYFDLGSGITINGEVYSGGD